MPKQATPAVGIFCQDTVFFRLLEIQLSLCGATSVWDLQSHPQQALSCGLWLVDLDDFSLSDLPVRPEDCFLCGWTRGDEKAHTWVDGAVVWHRPFSMKMFETVVGEILQGNDHLVAFGYAADVYRGGRLPLPEKDRSLVLQVLDTGDVMAEGRRISLTGKERALFDCLWRNRGQVVSKEALRACFSHTGDDVDTNALEVYICFLRRKLEQPTGRKLITTVRGVGYMLEEI